MSPPEIKNRIEELLRKLNEGLHERADVMRLALLASIAGESIFLLGPPGVAKSLIARKLKFAYHDAKSFEYLMGRFSTPDEIFGPISIKQLKDEDKYERLVEGYLPDADIVFLDEIWKASPAIQNSLLTVLNEKLFRNGRREVTLNIKGIIAASNELPADEGLEAIWDRFIIRMHLTGISDENLFNRMISESTDLYKDNVPEELKISENEYFSWRDEINEILVPGEVLHVIGIVRRKLSILNENIEAPEEMIYVSDRRWKKIIRLLKTAAFLNGRDAVDIYDCFIIPYCIWSEVSMIDEAQEIVRDAVVNFALAKSFGLSMAEAELSHLQEEIQAEIAYEVDVVEIQPKRHFNRCYRILGFDEYQKDLEAGEQVFIEAEVFDGLDDEPNEHTLFFSNNGLTMKHKKLFHVSRGEAAQVLIEGVPYLLETEPRVKYETRYRTPAPAKRKKWSIGIDKLKEFCRTRISEINDFRAAHNDRSRGNLFIDDAFQHEVLEGLDTIAGRIEKMQINIEKIKRQYEQTS